MTDFPLNNWIPLLFDEKCYLLFLSYSWFWWSFNSEPFTSLFIIIIINPIIPDCRKRTKQNLHEVIFTCNSIIIIISLRTNKRRKMNYFFVFNNPLQKQCVYLFYVYSNNKINYAWVFTYNAIKLTQNFSNLKMCSCKQT